MPFACDYYPHITHQIGHIEHTPESHCAFAVSVVILKIAPVWRAIVTVRLLATRECELNLNQTTNQTSVCELLNLQATKLQTTKPPWLYMERCIYILFGWVFRCNIYLCLVFANFCWTMAWLPVVFEIFDLAILSQIRLSCKFEGWTVGMPSLQLFRWNSYLHAGCWINSKWKFFFSLVPKRTKSTLLGGVG